MYSKMELVELVDVFYARPWRPVIQWGQEPLLDRFKAEEQCIGTENRQTELTDRGRETLHNFIMKETRSILETLKNQGKKKFWLSDILPFFDYGEYTEYFVDYLLRNDSEKQDTLIQRYSKATRKEKIIYNDKLLILK